MKTEAEEVNVENEEDSSGSSEALMLVGAQTPWWVVSILAHALIIAFAALLSIAIELPVDDPLIPQVTILREPVESPRSIESTEKKQGPQFPGPEIDDGPIDLPTDIRDAIFGNEEKTKTNEPYETEGLKGDPRAILAYGPVTGEPGGNQSTGAELTDVLIGVGDSGRLGVDGKSNGFGLNEGIGFASRGYNNRGARENMVKKNNRGNGNWRKPIDSCDLGLEWLAYHQEADGHWDAKKYEAAVKTDTAVTGFALLAFLGAGHTEKVGKYRGNVANAVKWLKSKQAADGCIWDTSDDGAGHRRVGYPSAIATLAMAEAAGMANVPDTKAAAQKAIDYCVEHHQAGEGYEKLGWRYAPKSEGDLSVSGWFIMALKSAKVSGLKVPAAAFDGAIKFLESVEIKNADAGGYGASRFKYMANQEHAQSAHRLTAIGTLARQFLGWKKDELQGNVDWFVNKGGVPSHGANGENVDLYYWYYGTLCVFQQGGEVWNKWNAGMVKALTENQCKQGDANGSWNPTGEFSTEWGRVGQTALSALCLEVYYRYAAMK